MGGDLPELGFPLFPDTRLANEVRGMPNLKVLLRDQEWSWVWIEPCLANRRPSIIACGTNVARGEAMVRRSWGDEEATASFLGAEV